MSNFRTRLYEQVDPLAWPGKGLSPANRAVMGVVLISIVSAILESEPEIRGLSPASFISLNAIFALAFSIEYGVRLWAMAASPEFAGWRGAMRYAKTLASVVDAIATLALWVDLLFGVPGFYGVLLRLVRVLRVLTLTRNSQWSIAVRLLGRAISERSTELSLSFGFAGIVLVISATVLFAAEGQAQPDSFGSIPRAMWWAVATLTTVGYGDVYPVTAIGKICAGIAALTSIAIVAMPTGIMAAAFSDAFQRIRGADNHAAVRTTPERT